MVKARKASDGRQRVLDSALHLMQVSGSAGASIGNILELSRAPRGSLYHYFPDGKEQIVREALLQFDESFTAAIRTVMARPGSIEDRLKRFVDGMIKQLRATSFRESCPVTAILLGLSDEDEGAGRLRGVCAAILEGWGNTAAEYMDEFEPAIARELGRKFVVALQGGWLMCRVAESPQPLRDAFDLMAAHLATRRAAG